MMNHECILFRWVPTPQCPECLKCVKSLNTLSRVTVKHHIPTLQTIHSSHCRPIHTPDPDPSARRPFCTPTLLHADHSPRRTPLHAGLFCTPTLLHAGPSARRTLLHALAPPPALLPSQPARTAAGAPPLATSNASDR